MAKSPLSRGSKQVKAPHSPNNVTALALTIPIKETDNRAIRYFDITYLTHLGCDLNNERIKDRVSYIKNFTRKSQEYVNNGNSAKSNKTTLEQFQTYVFYCDSQNVDPFSRAGYLKYFGNDGELRHQMKAYDPSLRIWQRSNGDVVGIKESTCVLARTGVKKALTWCGVYDESWIHQHRIFKSRTDPIKPYSEEDEKIIVSRLSDLFFGLASQLIAIKKEDNPVVDDLPVTIDFGSHKEKLLISNSLCDPRGKVRQYSAFNMTMGAAYHLFCYFTSLNDSIVREVCHPIVVETDSRDKSIKTIKVRGFKTRANKDVSATLTNEVDDSVSFDVEKKSGVVFIEILSELSLLYGSDKELLFTLDSNEQVSNEFKVKEINKHLQTQLNLVSSHRTLNLPWFRELFYTFQQSKSIELKTMKNKIGRTIVSKSLYQLDKSRSTKNILNISYLILSCFTGKSLKGALLPLTYSEKDKDGNVCISFLYQDGERGFFDVPISELSLVKDIEKWAKWRANSANKNHQHFLLRHGPLNMKPRQWAGFNPISSNTMSYWSIKVNDYFLSLQSSRFRETTSSQEYKDGHLSHLTNLLQNTLSTLDRHYANGHPETNMKILSQAIQVLERIATGGNLEQAKKEVREKLGIEILTHDAWLKKNIATNPNGVVCNGKQDLRNGKSTQRATNKAIGKDLACSEFDICYKCKSAKAVDEPNAIYKLISFIDVLKEALDHHPNAKQKVQDKIDAFEYTLEGASPDVFENAIAMFTLNGRHPRVTMNHALVSIYR